MQLVLDDWDGTTNRERVVSDPAFADIRDCLNKLDGKTHTLMSLELETGAAMQIGGGPDSYMSQTVNGEFCWLAHGSVWREGELSLVVGGQRSLFETSVGLSRAQAFDILSVFYHGDGVLTTNVHWQVL